jgi:6-phosphogluconolactonase (cycloisomerase 2 family)
MNSLRPPSRTREAHDPAAPPRRPLSFETLEDRVTPSTLIPVAGARDLVYDDARDLLYVTTTAGRVERYDANTGTLLTPFSVGINLNGADITAAGDFLYAAETAANLIRRVDLSTGAVTNFAYAGGNGAYDVGIAANGQVFFDARFAGSGSVTLFSLDPATGTITARRGVQQDTGIARGADRSRLFFQEANISNAPTFTYNSATNTFSATQTSSGFVGNNPASVSRDGSRVAFQFGGAISILDEEARTVEISGSGDGGLLFDPTRDVLYAINSATDQVVAYDTNTWREKFRVNILADVGAGGLIGNGALAISDDGRFLFLATTAGVRRIDLPTESGVARTFEVSGFPAFTGQGTPGTFTVTARDARGDVATGYRGTVRFTSTDPAAVLPADYTFTEADEGVRTFTATFQTVGTRSITATDVATAALLGSQSGIVIHNNTVSLIPVANRRDTVYDSSRGLLYISTADGRVQRYDVATQTLLAPLQVGVSLLGMDVSADNGTLYVSEGQRGANRSILRRVDLATGQVTNVVFAERGGGWDVNVAANGTVLFDAQFPGSGGVGLFTLDPATGAVTVRRGITQNSGIYRGADRSLLVFLASNISSGPFFTYSSATDTFPAEGGTGTFRDADLAAVNRNGTLIAMEVGGVVRILTPSLTLVEALGSVNGGVVFDPTRDVLYAVNPTTDEVVVYDTNTWAVLTRVAVGENVGTSDQFGNGVLTVSPDGTLLFLSTATGVRIIRLNQAPLANGGFEAPAVGAGNFQYTPSGATWAFSATAGVSGNGSGFTAGNPAAPEGGQVAFLQGAGSATQSFALAAGTYTVSFRAAQRGNFNPGGNQTVRVLVDGVVRGTFTPAGAGYETFTSAGFTLTGTGTRTVRLEGLAAGDSTALVDDVRFTPAGAPAPLANGGFEAPAVGAGNFQYNPVGATWTFGGQAGVSGNGSGFTSGNPAAPEGVQAAFLQNLGTATQTVSLAAGTYQVRLRAAQRGNFREGDQAVRVVVGGAAVGTFTPAGAAYQTFTSASFTLAADGTREVRLEGVGGAGDRTALVDLVEIVPGSPPPAPVPVANAGFEAPGVGAGGFQYNPAGTGWTFTALAGGSGSGVSGNGSGFTAGNPGAPEGGQVAFLQGAGSATQVVTGLAAGTYAVSLRAAQRGNFNPGGPHAVRVLVDGVVRGTFTPAGADYETFTTGSFALSAGAHTLRLEGFDVGGDGGDATALVDDVVFAALA